MGKNVFKNFFKSNMFSGTQRCCSGQGEKLLITQMSTNIKVLITLKSHIHFGIAQTLHIIII